MNFASTTFLFLFLPVSLVTYCVAFVLPSVLGLKRPAIVLGNCCLLAFSLLFYAWGEPLFVCLIVASTLVDYVCGMVIGRDYERGDSEQQPGLRKVCLLTSLVLNLASLCVFKYLNFGVENALRLLDAAGLSSPSLSGLPALALPIGISFYTFQSLSYTIDVYRRKVDYTPSLLNFAAFVTLFPQLVAGPIVRYADIARELAERDVTFANFAAGARRFALGLAKKVLIADTVASMADAAFGASPDLLWPTDAWLGAVCFALQIYFDFSGYSDMAIGLGRMLGFTFPENFNYPYRAKSIQDFWRRWHISLSTWFRDYLYIPLGGNRGSELKTIRNLWIVFFLCGLWHGASWTFIVWGLYQGVFLAFERTAVGKSFFGSLPTPIAHVVTLLIALGSWVIFRAPSMEYAMHYLQRMIGLGEVSAAKIALPLEADVLVGIVIGSVIALKWHWLIGRKLYCAAWNLLSGQRPLLAGSVRTSVALVCLGLLVLSVIQVGSTTHKAFIYFRF